MGEDGNNGLNALELVGQHHLSKARWWEGGVCGVVLMLVVVLCVVALEGWTVWCGVGVGSGIVCSSVRRMDGLACCGVFAVCLR